MDDRESYQIGELAELAGVTPRTIRYYTAEGLLPPPITRGKYARYGPEHLRRLRLIARLKAEYLPLSVIRDRLSSAEGGAPPPATGSGPEGSAQLRPRPRGASYPAPAGPRMSVRESVDPFRLAPAAPQVGRVEFFPDSAELLGGEADEESPPTARWQRIVVGPGVELHVREPLSDRRRRTIEGVVAALRDALLREDEGRL